MASPAPLIVPATARHTATVIFAHGLGDSCAGWIDVVRNWRLRNKLSQVKFVLPNAPTIPITCNGGYRMPGWFDITSLDGTIESLVQNEDEPGMLATRTYFSGLIQAEIDAGIAPSRIILGGFSQGGAMALLTGLTGAHKLGGLVALSCWLVLSGKFKNMVRADNKSTPVFMAHGTQDPLVLPEFNKISRQMLQAEGVSVEYHEYPMAHSACVEEIEQVTKFMEGIVGAQE
ncbi:hypothetical protein TD95_004546 [Thielaviopsis punctulata]|uniref:Acyl-protein thioesterase 1 n=1 Tax=Thielaviopsis punctulata TaxID=72032 RepID=A0A0F4ZL79_9PEZI|nr:hypothetical protein TD95_004546 [Thielaviopsis punctulata]